VNNLAEKFLACVFIFQIITSGPSTQISTVMKLRADVIEKFDPATGMDAARWFGRYELFVDISEGKPESEIDRSKQYLSFLPLFLGGDALLCFEEMRDEDRSNYALVKTELCEYYSMDDTTAYSKFCESKFEPGTSVDAFIAQLRKYAGILELGKYSCDKLILAQFMKAIPSEAASEIRGRCGRDNEELQLASVLKVARHLPSLNTSAPIAVVNERPEIRDKSEKRIPFGGRHRGQQRGDRERKSKLECYICGGEHMMKECPHTQQFRSMLSGNVQGPARA